MVYTTIVTKDKRNKPITKDEHNTTVKTRFVFLEIKAFFNYV